MGNICNQVQNKSEVGKKKRMRKKNSLDNPEVKKLYQEQLGMILNFSFERFEKRNIIQQIKIKGKLGWGSQGSIFLIELAQQNQNGDLSRCDYALKRISKKKLCISRVKEALLLEKQILFSHRYPFLTEIHSGFHDSSYIYYIMDIATGGDLYNFLASQSVLSLRQNGLKAKYLEIVKFILAGIILGLQYLHGVGIMYLDMKPQNILIYSDGYPKLADFGISEKISLKQKNIDIKGTTLYCSPEMVKRSGYNHSTDLWSLGILTYELVMGKTPFSENLINSRFFQRACEDFEKYSNIKKSECTQPCKDLIEKLLRIHPQQRLGFRNTEEIKKHPFFKEINWEQLQRKSIQSPLLQLKNSFNIEMKAKQEQIDDNISILDLEERVSFTCIRKSLSIQNSEPENSPTIKGIYESFSEIQDQQNIF